MIAAILKRPRASNHARSGQRCAPGRCRGRPARPRAGSPGTSRPTPGKLVPSAKTRNQPSSTRGSPMLQISQSISAAGSRPEAQDVAEPVVAVDQHRLDGGRGRRPTGASPQPVGARATSAGGTASIVRIQRASSSDGVSGVDRPPAGSPAVRRAGAAAPRRRGASGLRPAPAPPRGRRAPAPRTHPPPGPWRTRRAPRSSDRAHDGDRHVGVGQRLQDAGLAQHVVTPDRPLPRWHRLDHEVLRAGGQPVGEPRVPARHDRQLTDLQRTALGGAQRGSDSRTERIGVTQGGLVTHERAPCTH